MTAVVEWNSKRLVEVRTGELLESLAEMINSDPPATPAEALAHVKAKKLETALPERCSRLGLLAGRLAMRVAHEGGGAGATQARARRALVWRCAARCCGWCGRRWSSRST